MKVLKAIINGAIVTKSEILEGFVLFFNERIESIMPVQKAQDLLGNCEVFDAKGNYIAPGLIDLHIHGFYGHDVMDNSDTSLQSIRNALVRYGVTAFLPTTMTVEDSKIQRSLEKIRKSMNHKGIGARILGAHLEGPFINKDYKGSHQDKWIQPFNEELIADYLDVIKIITIAPEVNDNLLGIKKMANKDGILFSIGHSGATYEKAKESIDSGITRATHVFNAMSPLNHRAPGVVGAVFDSDINCELIADNVHVHPSMYKILLNQKGIDKIVLITDAMKAAGLEVETSNLAGQKVYIEQGVARLSDGTIAASVLTLNKAVKNFMDYTGISIQQAMTTSTLNPAKELGIDHDFGSIDVGKVADIIIVDESFEVKYTFISGTLAFNQENFNE